MSWKRTGDWDKVPSILEEAVKRVERAVLFNLYVIGGLDRKMMTRL